MEARMEARAEKTAEERVAEKVEAKVKAKMEAKWVVNREAKWEAIMKASEVMKATVIPFVKALDWVNIAQVQINFNGNLFSKNYCDCV